MDLKISGKTVIITGGAKGIGAGISSTFAREGCNVIVNYRSDAESAYKFADGLMKMNVQAIAIEADVSKESEADSLFQQAVNKFGKIDILVNNAAGGYHPNPFQNITSEEWQIAKEGLLDPSFYMSKIFVQHCLDLKKCGHIINVLSKSAILSSSVYNLAYVANKGAMVSLTRGMAKEFIPYGIYVNGIVPGYVKTERIHVDGDERTERVRALLPTKEFAMPEDIGNVAVILASPLFKQMIGSVVDCTGGTLI